MRSIKSDPLLNDLNERIQGHAEKFGLTLPEIRFFILEAMEFASLLEKKVYPVSPVNIWEGKNMVNRRFRIESGQESSLFYEVVQTGNPSYAYLNYSNSPMMQASVMAHVCGHCEFSELNVLKDSNRDRTEYVLYLGRKVQRSRRQMGDPLYQQYWNACESAIPLIAPNSRFNLDNAIETEGRISESSVTPEEESEVLQSPGAFSSTLDKRNLDIIESLMQHPRNRDKPLSEIIDTYVRIEEIEFSNAQARGIANIDTMENLQMGLQPLKLGQKALDIINQHLPSHFLYNYTGAIIAANRGILHIHDAFGSSVGSSQPGDLEYKPLLMLLGSGRVSCEATQASVDNTVVITTNIEEMARLETHLTSSKLLDRIEKVPVNYLLDTNSEMDILRRDLSLMHEKYDVDPNLLRLASYFSVLTRFLPPLREKFPPQWSKEKIAFYKEITPEQKLFIYSCQAEDPAGTIRRLPHWHPFCNEALRLGIDIDDQEELNRLLFHLHEAVNLESSGVFSLEQLQLIDDEFMRLLWNEHFPNEGQHGISVRQLQNIMRDTIAASDGRKIHVGTLFSQLQRIVAEGHALHHWLTIDQSYKRDRNPLAPRRIGSKNFNKGCADYGDYPGSLEIAQALYFEIIRREITVATVDRDPKLIDGDLRRYLQNVLLARAVTNQAFAHIMVPRYSFVDPDTGAKVERPDLTYMSSIEKIIAQGKAAATIRNQLAEKFLQLQSSGELVIEEGKNIINSRDDNLTSCFVAEYTRLLSHGKTVEGDTLDELNEAFFQKRNAPENYTGYRAEIRSLVETILNNMTIRYRYSQSLALDTVVFALRKKIINFQEIIT